MSKMGEFHIEKLNEEFEKMCLTCKHWTQDGCEAKKGDRCIVDEKRDEKNHKEKGG